MRKFLAVLNARNKEFFRDRAAAGWNILFPILVIFGFAFAFSEGSQDILKVSVISASLQAQSQDFTKTRYIQFIPGFDLKSELENLKHHRVDMVLANDSEASGRYWVNSTSPKGYLAEKILLGSPHALTQYQKQTVEGREIRYVDWLISGLLAMNMMFSADKTSIQIFPLTHVIDAARAIMTEGAGLQAVSYNIMMLFFMTSIFLLASSLAFKWK